MRHDRTPLFEIITVANTEKKCTLEPVYVPFPAPEILNVVGHKIQEYPERVGHNAGIYSSHPVPSGFCYAGFCHRAEADMCPHESITKLLNRR